METKNESLIVKVEPIKNNIIFDHFGEMLKIAPDGFYVRGEKIPQDHDEANKVYDAFVNWLRNSIEKNEYTCKLTKEHIRKIAISSGLCDADLSSDSQLVTDYGDVTEAIEKFVNMIESSIIERYNNSTAKNDV